MCQLSKFIHSVFWPGSVPLRCVCTNSLRRLHCKSGAQFSGQFTRGTNPLWRLTVPCGEAESSWLWNGYLDSLPKRMAKSVLRYAHMQEEMRPVGSSRGLAEHHPLQREILTPLPRRTDNHRSKVSWPSSNTKCQSRDLKPGLTIQGWLCYACVVPFIPTSWPTM